MAYTIHYFARIAGAFLLAGAVIVAPWLFRSSVPNAEVTVRALVTLAAAAALAALLVAPRRVRQNRSFGRMIPAALILLAGIAIGFLQVLPHSLSSLGFLSPAIPPLAEELLPREGTEEAVFEKELLGAAEPDRGGKTGFWPSAVSVCTQVTKDQTAELIFVFAAFVSASILFQTKRQRLLLWRAIAINGLLLALLVIAQKIFGDRLFGYRHFWPEAHCGPFVNRNGMAGYLALCLAPAVSLLFLEVLIGIRLREEDEDLYYDGIRYEQSSGSLRFLNGVSDFLTLFSGRVIPWLLAVAVILAGAAMTLSRGGTLAALFTFATAAVLFSLRKKTGFYLIPVWGGLLLAFLLLFWLGVSEPIQQRMGTLAETEEHESELKTNPRLDNWKSALQTAGAYRLRGSGLGTYPLANRSRDKALRINRYFFFAENISVETLVTAGAFGLLLLIGGYLLFWYYVFLALRAKRQSELLDSAEENALVYEVKQENADLTYIFGIGIAALLAGQAVSGSFDFGLLLYPNALAAALVLGSFSGGKLDNSDDSASEFLAWEEKPAGRLKPFFFAGAVLLSAAALLLVVPAFLQIYNRVESTRVIARYPDPVSASEERDLAYFDHAVNALKWAIPIRPDDPAFHYQLAQIYTAKFRYLFLEQLKEEFPDADPAELWNRTTPEAVFASMQPFYRNKMKVVPRRFRSDPIVAENLVPALRELWIVRRLCPLYPEPHVDGAVLAPLLYEMDDYSGYIRASLERLETISPNEPNVFYSAGLIEFLTGDTDAAAAKWKESAALSDERLADITTLLASERLRADFRRHLDMVVAGDWQKALRGITLFPKKESPLIYSVYLELMQQILADSADKTSAEWYYRNAVCAKLSDRPAEALDFYQKALEADPYNAAWHYEFGRFLQGAGRPAEAADEFARASELDPKNRAYRKAAEK